MDDFFWRDNIYCFRELCKIEGEYDMDAILLPELRRLHEELRTIEKNLTKEEKKEKHKPLVQHCEEILNYYNWARKEGLLYLEIIASEKEDDPEYTFDMDLIRMIVDGCDPKMIQRVILIKYFSTEQNIYQSIKNIMSIYGLLSIQAGENPRILTQLLKNMLPVDINESVDRIYKHLGEKTQKKEKHIAINLDDYCVGDIRIKEKDIGYFETKICDEMLLSVDCRALQRVLRDISMYSLSKVLMGLSGACRRHIFNNLSERVALDLVIGLKKDDPNNKDTYYLQSKWDLQQMRQEAINILSIIDNLEKRAEIVCSVDSNVRFLSIIMTQLAADNERKCEKEKECDLLIEAIKNYKRYKL